MYLLRKRFTAGIVTPWWWASVNWLSLWLFARLQPATDPAALTGFGSRWRPPH